jgi:hypothetical protein
LLNIAPKPLTQTHFPSRYWKRLGLSVLSLIILLSGFAVYVNLHWKPFLTRQIKEAIITSTDSLYAISFDDVSVNILTGSASFRNIRFTPDTLVYKQMIARKEAPKHLFIIEVAQLDLTTIHPIKIYYQRKLEMSSLRIDRPKMKMIFQKLTQPQNTGIDNRNAYQRLSKYLKLIKIDAINFQDADFEYIDRSARHLQTTRLKSLDINIAGLLIDSASQFNRSKLYYTDDIALKLKDYEFRTPDSLYNLKIKELSASTRNKFARVTGFKLIPRYSEMAFSQKLPVQTDRYACRFDEISLEGIDFKAFNTDRLLLASKLKISNSNTNIFRNKARPLDQNDRRLSFPQIALRHLNLETRIDSVFISNSRMAYAEYSPITRLRGEVFLDQVEGFMTNVTNDSSSLVKNPKSKAKLTGLLMGRGRFDVTFDFNLVDQAASFKLNGSLGNMSASLFNPILRPLTLVQIRSGFIERMQFAFNGNLNATHGNLSVKYNDLKVALLSKQENTSRLKKRGIASIAANVLILNSENPSPGKSFRVAKVHFSRPDSVSFISMNVKGMLVGLRDIIGLDPATQRKIQVKLRELKIMKSERQQRRQERLKRKESRREKNNRP